MTLSRRTLISAMQIARAILRTLSVSARQLSSPSLRTAAWLLFAFGSILVRANAQIAIPASGIINTIGGNGVQGYSGDSGLAVDSEVNRPLAVRADANGNIYISDTGNNVIREVSAETGIITTVAGNGVRGYGGDEGLATSAELNVVTDFAFDSSGNLYIADNANNRIRKLTIATGIITTVVGNGTAGYSGDNGPAADAELSGPNGIAIDSAGNLFIADYGNNVIRMVTPSTGIINTVVGNGTAGFSGDGGNALSAEMNGPEFIAFDTAGDQYIVDNGNSRIRKVTPSGTISTVAGNGQTDSTGDGGPATLAGLNPDGGIGVDRFGDIFFSDSANNKIRMVSPTTGLIATVAGDGSAWYCGDGGPAGFAQIQNPQDLALDSAGNIYIADSRNNRIRVIGAFVAPATPGAGIIETVAGDDVYGYMTTSGLATAAQFEYPDAIRPDANGNVYVADINVNIVREISAGSGVATTVIGNLTPGYSGDGGPATNAMIGGVSDLAFDSAGNLYLADVYNNRIRKWTLSTGYITTVKPSCSGVECSEIHRSGRCGQRIYPRLGK